MTEAVFELLSSPVGHGGDVPRTTVLQDPGSRDYIARLSSLSITALQSNESDAIAQSAHSTLRSIQALSKRSYRSVIIGNDHLDQLSGLAPALKAHVSTVRDALPDVDTAAQSFADTYGPHRERSVLDRRKRIMQLDENVDRLGNILDLPTLLSSVVNSSVTQSAGSSSQPMTAGYASALDIHAQIKRIGSLYPTSAIVQELCRTSTGEIQALIATLISSLEAPGLKLAAAMRTIGWLRRVAPDAAGIDTTAIGRVNEHHNDDDEALGALFLVCRLNTLRRTLEALDPLRKLADLDTDRRAADTHEWAEGSQTERYLKRYIELFREHSFAIISTYKSVFPTAMALASFTDGDGSQSTNALQDNSQQTTLGSGHAPALATFVPYLVDMLCDTLHRYMPNLADRSARESLLTQVLYCAASLGRLGADFGMLLCLLEDELTSNDDDTDAEWVNVLAKQRVQAGRLEQLAHGNLNTKKTPTTQHIETHA